MKDPGAADPALARMMGWFLILLARATRIFASGARIHVHYRPRAPGGTAVFLTVVDILDYFSVELRVVLFVPGVPEARKHALPA